MSEVIETAGTDEELLRRHIGGDPGAFTELVSRHRDRLWSLAIGILRHSSDAEDALQTALLKAWQAAATFRFRSSVYSWLFRIVTNSCLDSLRRQRPTSELPTEFSKVAQATELNPEQVVLASEDRERVQAALTALDPDRRAAVVLVDGFGWSVSEAAEILGVPPGTIKSRCARGRKILAKLLAEVTP